VSLLACLSCAAFAQSTSHTSGGALSVAEIFQQHGGPVGEAPKDFVWSPDGNQVSYLAEDSEHGQPGDLVGVQAATGVAKVLVNNDMIESLYDQANDVRDLDHRARYDQSIYTWVPDEKHLLFDAAGDIWLHDLTANTDKKLAATGAGSGDDPKFSPNGKMLSFVSHHNLHVVALENNQEQALTNTHSDALLHGEVDWVYEEELDVRSNYFWSPDSQHIVYLQMEEAAVPQYPLADWMPRHSTVDEQRYPQPSDPNPAVRLGVVGAHGGNTFWLRLPVAPNNDYVPRFGWLDNQTVWVEVLRRDHKHRALYFADIATGRVRQVLAETAHRFLDEDYDMEFLPDGEFLWTSWHDGHTHIYLYAYNAAHPLLGHAHLQRQLTRGPWEVLSLAGVDARHRVVYYTSNKSDPREEMLWKIQLDGTGQQMLSTQHGVHKISFNDQGDRYVDTVSSTMQSPVVRVCAVSGTAQDCHPFWHAHALDGVALIAPKQIVSRADDGTTLYGSLLLPPDRKTAASVPLILNPYGGPHVQVVRDEWSKGTLFDQLLVQHGFAVLHVDNRGMGNRGRAFAEAAYRNFGPVQLQDQLTVLDQVLAQYPQLDPKRLGWWGWSWGGTFTLYAMTHSDRFAAGVAVAPVTDWHLYDSIYTERYIGTPAENAQGYQEDSVVNSAGQLHGHLLLAHGTGDDNVHLQNSMQLIHALIAANKQYDLLLFPQLTHSLDTPAARTQLYERILQHFQMYLQNPK